MFSASACPYEARLALLWVTEVIQKDNYML